MVDFDALIGRIKSCLGKNLVSMAVFGSYARGDYKPGSDVDLIIVVKDKTRQVASQILSLEHELMGKSVNWVDKKASKFLNFIGFKKSLFLFDEKEFSKKKFNFCDSKLLASLFIPKGIIWRAIKKEGRLVYGKDILNFSYKVSAADKIKAPLPGICACLFASLLFPFARDRAVTLAQTGLRWTYMNVMGLLKRSEIKSIFWNFVEVFRVAFRGNYA